MTDSLTGFGLYRGYSSVRKITLAQPLYKPNALSESVVVAL